MKAKIIQDAAVTGHIIVCDECQGEYTHDNIHIITEKCEDKDVERQHYLCPHCGHDYTIIITNPEIRALISKRNKSKSSYEKITLTDKIKKLVDNLMKGCEHHAV